MLFFCLVVYSLRFSGERHHQCSSTPELDMAGEEKGG